MNNQTHTLTRKALIKAYRIMADLTQPCCGACRVPHSCCAPEHCRETIEWAKTQWGVELPTTNNHRNKANLILPLMGPNGCTAAPHLRPICTLHTCDINSLGCKRGDPSWTEQYYKLRDRITLIELRLPTT